MIRYVITTALDGTVRLSKVGHWGNIPMGSESHAEDEAKRDAGKAEHTIDRKRLRV